MYDPLHDIHHYSKNLTISQVVKFFEKKEMGITRAMIQNYIRDGLLPPPVSKRNYTHKHLAALVMIVYLKTVYEMADLKEALTPLMDEEGLPLEIYALVLQKLDSLSRAWKETMSPLFFESKTPPDDKSGVSEAVLSKLLLMTHTADLKALTLTLSN